MYITVVRGASLPDTRRSIGTRREKIKETDHPTRLIRTRLFFFHRWATPRSSLFSVSGHRDRRRRGSKIFPQHRKVRREGGAENWPVPRLTSNALINEETAPFGSAWRLRRDDRLPAIFDCPPWNKGRNHWSTSRAFRSSFSRAPTLFCGESRYITDAHVGTSHTRPAETGLHGWAN